MIIKRRRGTPCRGFNLLFLSVTLAFLVAVSSLPGKTCCAQGISGLNIMSPFVSYEMPNKPSRLQIDPSLGWFLSQPVLPGEFGMVTIPENSPVYEIVAKPFWLWSTWTRIRVLPPFLWTIDDWLYVWEMSFPVFQMPFNARFNIFEMPGESRYAGLTWPLL